MNEARLAAMHDFCASIPASKALALVAALRACQEPLPAAEYGRICGLGSPLAADLAVLLRHYATPAELASAIETGVYHQQKAAESRLDFVWSGPSRLFSTARKTEQVLLDLVNEARERILLASFAVYKIPSLLAALENALASGLRVRIILENSRDSQGQLAHDGKEAFAALAGAEYYHWPLGMRPRNAAGLPAKMHVKCALNESSYLITSANLTNDAICRNIELGILRCDKTEAAKLAGQFELLIQKGILVRS